MAIQHQGMVIQQGLANQLQVMVIQQQNMTIQQQSMAIQ